MQVLYLFIKRLFKLSFAALLRKLLIWKKILAGNEKQTKAFIKKWSKMKKFLM